jgi:hypothetical protein
VKLVKPPVGAAARQQQQQARAAGASARKSGVSAGQGAVDREGEENDTPSARDDPSGSSGSSSSRSSQAATAEADERDDVDSVAAVDEQRRRELHRREQMDKQSADFIFVENGHEGLHVDESCAESFSSFDEDIIELF